MKCIVYYNKHTNNKYFEELFGFPYMCSMKDPVTIAINNRAVRSNSYWSNLKNK